MFNVCDSKGKHLGFVCDKSPFGQGWQVALCKSPLENCSINWKAVKKRLADHYGNRSYWVRLDDGDLLDWAKREWGTEHAHDIDLNFTPYTPEDYYKFMFLKYACEFTDCQDSKAEIDGFVIMDSILHFYNQDYLLLDAELDYVTVPAMNNNPIFGVISDYPRIGIRAMGAWEGLFLGANLSDYGGRNHTHITSVRIKSGNIEMELHFPIQISFKKGEPVQIFLDEGDITRVFYDGAFYFFNAQHGDQPRPVYDFDS